jgi:hypothetical protein
MSEEQPHALTDKEMRTYLDNKCNLVMYSDIRKYKSVDELLGKYGRCIILYIWKQNANNQSEGHWVSIVKTADNKIRFTDSFGAIVDKPIEKLSKYDRQRFNEDYKYLSDLLINCPYKLEYNEKRIQNKHSQVCGYYNILACIMANEPLKSFQNLFSKDTLANDKLVFYLITGNQS